MPLLFKVRYTEIQVPRNIEFGEFNTETRPLLKITFCQLQETHIVEYGAFNAEILPLL
jgi:hypothetical protein